MRSSTFIVMDRTLLILRVAEALMNVHSGKYLYSFKSSFRQIMSPYILKDLVHSFITAVLS